MRKTPPPQDNDLGPRVRALMYAFTGPVSAFLCAGETDRWSATGVDAWVVAVGIPAGLGGYLVIARKTFGVSSKLWTTVVAIASTVMYQRCAVLLYSPLGAVIVMGIVIATLVGPRRS